MIPAKGYAAQTATDSLAPWTFERRSLGNKDVQVEILYCGVCHSDLHQVRNEWGGSIYPMVPGHEIVGKVVAVGSNVTRHQSGDIVGVGVIVDSCRKCENCKDDMEQYCIEGPTETYNSSDRAGNKTYGGYSNVIVTNEDFVYKIDPSLNLPGVAPLLCAGITTWSPLKHWNVGKGHKLAVLGLGGLGHMAVKFGVALGAEVTILSTSPAKEENAKRLGAHHFVVTKDPEQAKPLKRTFDFIIDTVSAPHDLNFYLKLLKLNGVHICVGLPPTPPEVSVFNLTGARRSVAGSMIGGIKETQDMLDFCASHNITADIELINIQDIHKAFDRMEKGDVKYRFVIDMASL